MRVTAAAILVGLLAAGTTALAKDSNAHKRTAALAVRAAVHRAAAEPVAHGRHHNSIGAAQTRTKDNDTHVASVERQAAATAAEFPADVGWQLIEDPATGARLGLPEKFVPHAAVSPTGSRWTSAQGQIQIETFRLTEAALPALFEQEKKASRRQVASSQIKPDSFIIAGVQGLKDFVVRAEARGSEVRGVTVLYDQAIEGRMERIGAAVVSAFAGFPDPKAGPVAGMRRMVEYGTAIVVSSDGDLIASANLTEECQAITVPGLGHAERVAADTASGLALIRLYGARNLVPARLAGDSTRGGEVTLVGVADPVAQAGGADVSKSGAHLSAQTIDPAPKLGFCGAAAADAGGALAGMVDFKPPVVAGNGSAGQGAALVPAAAIRAFLAAHGISPAATDPAAIEQSVVRVVCVRKLK